MLFNLSKISLLRSKLMGVGTLLIIICHAYGNNVKMPSILSKIVNNGQIGVDIFLLLSGIGIAYSLSNTNIFDSGKSLKEWYIKRVLRIYKPFTILSVCYYIYKFSLRICPCKSHYYIFQTYHGGLMEEVHGMFH